MKHEHTRIEAARHALSSDLIHDLRTPLNHIIGYSEMLVERAREAGQADFVVDLERVNTAGHSLLDMINENFYSTAASATNGSHAGKDHVQKASSKDFAEEPRELAADRKDPAGLILVVDDDEGNRDVLSRRLEKQGYTVSNAANGRRALEMLQTDAYDLVLLDIMMPEMDGYEVLRCLKADDRLQRLPVIMISALSDMESVVRCIEMGAEDYLPKPFNPTLLKARIGASLGKKRAHDRELKLFEQLEQNYNRLQELEKIRDDLTNMIIHDLRTPLTSVMAALQTLNVVGDLNKGQCEVMEIAISGSEGLLSEINSLLDVEKFESGTMDLEYTLLALPELVAAAVADVAALAAQKKITVIRELEAELPWLYGDENKLQRILVNLLGNALKFTPSGGCVTLEARQGDDMQSVEFSVRDTGEGIPAEAFGRIFEKFGQVESRQGGRTMSTGLGLTFCKLAVESHGGQIGVDSIPGKGSKFYFTIPLPSSPK